MRFLLCTLEERQLPFPAADFYGVGIDAEEDVAEDVGFGYVELVEPF